MRKIFSILMVIIGCFTITNLDAAPVSSSKAKKGISVVSKGGTSVRARVAPTGIYDQSCYEAYYGCMDQFCVGDSAVLNIPGEPVTLDGGTCACSNDNQGFKDKIAKMNERLNQANILKTIEVEKVEAGAKADIIFTGSREYDDSGKVVGLDKKDKKADRQNLLALWDDIEDDEEAEIDIADLSGAELYSAANELCKEQMPENCNKDMNFLTSFYSSQIKSDCKAFDNTIAKMQATVDAEYASAEKEVRDARMASFETANEYDRGTCMLNFRKCMTGEDVCGADWSKCVNFIAAENMQNNKRTENVSAQKVEHIAKYKITDTTMEILESKRNICENVLDKCVAVRDNVWDDFLREVAPTLKVAELNAESNLRQSCLTDISNCIQKACKDDIEGKGVATMDACLSRPDMARSFCKVQIETCERMEPLIWGYVTDKLASMRVDACTTEVKNCLTSEDRCGKDYSGCVGLDTDTIIKMCPEDKLVGCQKNGVFSWNEVERIISGIMLNIDNNLLEVCQNAVDEAMVKVCGDTESCDNLIVENGGLSLKYEVCEYKADPTDNSKILPTEVCYTSLEAIPEAVLKDNTRSGFAGFIKNTLFWGEISYDFENNTFTSWDEYKDSVGLASGSESEKYAREGFDLEMKQLGNSVTNAIKTIESDPVVQFCMTGREVQGMRDDKGRLKKLGGFGKDFARFPNITQQLRGIIATSALIAAQKKYSEKYEELNIKMASDQVKAAEKLDVAATGQTCFDLAKTSTLPKSKAPKKSDAGKWVAVGLLIAVGVTATILTAGAAAPILIVGASVAAAATGGATAIAVTGNTKGEAHVENWNYKESVTTTWNADSGVCTKVRVYQNCKKVKKNYCKEWEEPKTETQEISLRGDKK
ncbi:MAG: hypothetical protein GX944_03265 [Alphaproteobacteria bacterium]|nr:hypothetical protein [Alphaproteobacteria bacterium]